MSLTGTLLISRAEVELVQSTVAPGNLPHLIYLYICCFVFFVSGELYKDGKIFATNLVYHVAVSKTSKTCTNNKYTK